MSSSDQVVERDYTTAKVTTSEPCACQPYVDAVTSLCAAVRAGMKDTKTLRRIDEVVVVHDRMGIDVPTAELKVALNKEEK